MKNIIIRLFNLLKDEDDTFSYKGWLVSDSLAKRSLAVFGHYFLGYILFVVFLILAVFVFVIVVSVVGGVFTSGGGYY